MSENEILIEEKDGVFFLSGVIGENADFTELMSADTPLRLNLKGIEGVNSVGIRNLLKFLNYWGERPLIYQECPSDFIDQINMIPAILGAETQAEVESFVIPYACDECGHEAESPGTTEEVKNEMESSGSEPTQTCPECNSEMYVIFDSFFHFITSRDG